jgi:hypothetical protein
MALVSNDNETLIPKMLDQQVAELADRVAALEKQLTPEVPGQQTVLEHAQGKTDGTITKAQELLIDLRTKQPTVKRLLRAVDFLLDRYIVEP